MGEPDKTISKEQVEAYYDTFKEHQKKLGINIRHRTIFRNLKKAGLKPSSSVLEVGCGIGTVSSLIIRYLHQGFFVGADISPESIAFAQKTFEASKNANFIVSDMSDFTSPRKFDFIVLPDVLEHIPVEQHSNLFRILAGVSTSDARVLINIPEPNCLAWLRQTHPEKLQIIDQSLSMQELLNNTYPHGFKMTSMTPYSLQYEEPEYLSIVLEKNPALKNYHRKSTTRRGVENILSKF